MKYLVRTTSTLLVLLILFTTLTPHSAFAGKQFPLGFSHKEVWIDGNHHIRYPIFVAKESFLANTVEKINREIMKTARLSEYLELFRSVTESGPDFILNYDSFGSGNAAYGQGYLGVLVRVRSDMAAHLPMQVDYPMLFDMASGDRVPFEALFIDPEGAKAYIEHTLLDNVQQELSGCMQNDRFLPIPYEQFALSRSGHITFYYSKDQLSFDNGSPGAISFRLSELWNFLDISPSGIAISSVSYGQGMPTAKYPSVYQASLGLDELMKANVQHIMDYIQLGNLAGLNDFLPSVGSTAEYLYGHDPFGPIGIYPERNLIGATGIYPAGGYYFRLEAPETRGSLILIDESRTLVTGLLTKNIDAFGIETGKTHISNAMQWLGQPNRKFRIDSLDAQRLMVCEGGAVEYRYADLYLIDSYTLSAATLTLYADAGGIVQYVKLAMERN